MSHPIVDQAFQEFSEVGKIAVIVELKIRLLASKIPKIEEYAHSHRISETEAALLPYLVEQNLISEEEKNHLEASRRIRNKIFHCEFESAVDFIEKLRGKPLPPGAVTGAKISELEGENMLEKILSFAEAVQSGKTAKGTFKVDQTTTKEAGIFGWLVDALTKGVLQEGKQIATESLAVLDRVFDTLAKQDMKGSS